MEPNMNSMWKGQFTPFRKDFLSVYQELDIGLDRRLPLDGGHSFQGRRPLRCWDMWNPAELRSRIFELINQGWPHRTLLPTEIAALDQSESLEFITMVFISDQWIASVTEEPERGKKMSDSKAEASTSVGPIQLYGHGSEIKHSSQKVPPRLKPWSPLKLCFALRIEGTSRNSVRQITGLD